MESLTLGNVLVVILAIAGAIVTLGGATAVIKRWLGSSKGMKNQEEINKLKYNHPLLPLFGRGWGEALRLCN